MSPAQGVSRRERASRSELIPKAGGLEARPDSGQLSLQGAKVAAGHSSARFQKNEKDNSNWAQAQAGDNKKRPEAQRLRQTGWGQDPLAAGHGGPLIKDPRTVVGGGQRFLLQGLGAAALVSMLAHCRYLAPLKNDSTRPRCRGNLSWGFCPVLEGGGFAPHSRGTVSEPWSLRLWGWGAFVGVHPPTPP